MAFKTLSVGEIQAMLEPYDDSLPVTVMSNYGDRAQTMQAIKLDQLDLVDLEPTNYSESGYEVVEQGKGEIEALVLNYDPFLL